MEKTLFNEKKQIAKKYLAIANEKWGEIVKTKYLCYETYSELASEIIYKLFKKDMFNDISTYYKKNEDYSIGKVENVGNTFKVLCELEENVYFQFDIVTRYGIDIPQRVKNGKFRILKNIPKGWKDIWELLDKEESECE